MRSIKHFLLAAIALLLFNACTSDDDVNPTVQKTKLTINFVNPKDVVINEYKDVKIKFKEINTNVEVEKEVTGKPITLELNQGSYEISLDGMVSYTFNGSNLESGVSAYVNQLTLDKDTMNEDIQLSLKSNDKDLIFEEIFFTGTKAPKGGNYLGDKYFKIYNNTDHTLYADGLIIAQSAFQTTDKQDYIESESKKPVDINEYVLTDAMIQIPGNGTEHPIEPGKSIIIASDAINHRENNPNSIDLSKADFEFYYPEADDPDNPSVPNVTNFYDRLVLNDRGNNSYVMFRLPKDITPESYLTDYKYTYTYNFVYGGVSYPMGDNDAMKIPNKWIIDVVNLSVVSDFQWLFTSPSLDSGWAHCAESQGDEGRYGKSVIRKVIQNIDGRKLLQDTNNSTVDFNSNAIPSLMK